MDKTSLKNTIFASMEGLSVLIPVYCDSCVEQVMALVSQCQGLDMQWEIVVADDGSPSPYDALNDDIANWSGCRLIKRPINVGRAAIRNFLAHEARFDTLLYIDAGMMPSDGFINRFVASIGKAMVVCGSIGVKSDCVDRSNLRCLNEIKAINNHSYMKSNMNPYLDFHSGNFMIDRQTMLNNPFRENIKTYGYEDTLFGRDLSDSHISVTHIDNPLLFVRFESNMRFLEKTEEAMRTLYAYRKELKGYSALLHLVDGMQRLHLLWITVWISRLTRKRIIKSLLGDSPGILMFNIYRICCLSECYRKDGILYTRKYANPDNSE